jgi:hypothetical protein
MKFLLQLTFSMFCALVGVSCSMLRIWRVRQRFGPQHINVHTARTVAVGFGFAAVSWLVYGLIAGYADMLKAEDRAWQLAVHSQALWSVPLFISAIAWSASLATGWLMHLLLREGARNT